MSNDLFELYDLAVYVRGDRDRFVCSHKLGHAFDVIGENILLSADKPFSMYALAALLPLLPAKQRLTHPYDWMTTDTVVACPDPHCGAVFEIERKPHKTTFSHADVTRVALSQRRVDNAGQQSS
jgi:uncharacterized repeat protein (TIGR04076 family)